MIHMEMLFTYIDNIPGLEPLEQLLDSYIESIDTAIDSGNDAVKELLNSGSLGISDKFSDAIELWSSLRRDLARRNERHSYSSSSLNSTEAVITSIDALKNEPAPLNTKKRRLFL